MAIDVLQDVLDTIRLHGLIAGIHTFTTPWGYATTPDSQDIAFLVMVQGGGMLEIEEGDPPVRTLQSGDIVVLPRRTRYILRDKMHSPVLLFTELTELQTQRQGAVGNTTRIASGCYQFVNSSKKPVFSVLPPLIHLRTEDYQPIPELDLLVRLFLAEAAHEGSSQAAILNRLADCDLHDPKQSFGTEALRSQRKTRDDLLRDSETSFYLLFFRHQLLAEGARPHPPTKGGQMHLAAVATDPSWRTSLRRSTAEPGLRSGPCHLDSDLMDAARQLPASPGHLLSHLGPLEAAG